MQNILLLVVSLPCIIAVAMFLGRNSICCATKPLRRNSDEGHCEGRPSLGLGTRMGFLVSRPFSYPEPFLRAVNRARRGALAKSKPDTIKTWYPVKHCACSTSNADKHFGFLVCFVLKVFLQENPTKAVGFANFIYLNQLVGKT